MIRRYLLAGSTALVALGVDQLTKSLAVAYLRSPVHLIGPLSLRLMYNSGAAFSLGRGFSTWLAGLGIVLVAVLLLAIRRVPTRTGAVAMGLVLGGALGNLTDRIIRHHQGAVIDFIYTSWWPTFNVADSCIVVGAVLLVIATWSHGAHRRPAGR